MTYTDFPPELAGEVFLAKVRKSFAELAEQTPPLTRAQRQELAEIFTDGEVLIMHESAGEG
jgi:hypothetical protein